MIIIEEIEVNHLVKIDNNHIEKTEVKIFRNLTIIIIFKINHPETIKIITPRVVGISLHTQLVSLINADHNQSRSQDRPNNDRYNTNYQTNRPRSHERQINNNLHYGRSRDRDRNCDSRDRTPNHSSERNNSRDSSRGQSSRVHLGRKGDTKLTKITMRYFYKYVSVSK